MFYVLLYTTLKADLNCIDIFLTVNNSTFVFEGIQSCVKNVACELSCISSLSRISYTYLTWVATLDRFFRQRAIIRISRSCMHWYVRKNYITRVKQQKSRSGVREGLIHVIFQRMTREADTLVVLKQCVLLMSDIIAMPIHELLGALFNRKYGT